MKNLMPASTIDAPFLTKNEAINMPEFSEGRAACLAGKSIIDNPYSITKQSELHQDILRSADWRIQFENRFQAWMFGFSDI